MHKYLILFTLGLILISCGSSKKSVSNQDAPSARYYDAPADKRIIAAVNNALTYEGVHYKWGGTDRKGMDCSGLIYTAFKKEQIMLPRVSRNMATEGQRIKDRDLTIGDLLFFKTEGSRRINHVGLVVDKKRKQILFIHSTVSLGVIVSSLDESYWKKYYTHARRIR